MLRAERTATAQEMIDLLHYNPPGGARRAAVHDIAVIFDDYVRLSWSRRMYHHRPRQR